MRLEIQIINVATYADRLNAHDYFPPFRHSFTSKNVLRSVLKALKYAQLTESFDEL